MKLLVLDGNSILNRAFYGIKLLTTKNGQYTNAIFGFLNILLKLQDSENPDEIAIAFDRKSPTFRHKMYDGYKAKRKGMPEELASQMPILKELLAAMGYKEVSIDGYEADDILGTLAHTAAQRQEECLLATGDKDSLQLVAPSVTVLLTTTQMGRGETTRMDMAAIQEKYGVTPAQLIEVKALMGDASDNIPGVAGVGEKTAFALIQKFGTLDSVYENLQDPSIKEGVRKKLGAGRESAYMSYKLAKIFCEVPIDTHVGAYAKAPADAAKVAQMLSGLEMHSLLNRLNLQEVEATPAKDAPTLDSHAPTELAEAVTGKVYLCPAGEEWLVVTDAPAVYTAPCTSPNLLDLLCNPQAEKWVFDSKELYRLTLAAGRQAQNIVFDGTLAAYLLNPSGSGYIPLSLAPEYSIEPSFLSEGYPNAGVLAALCTTLATACEESGMSALLKDIEQPLAEVLASMELCGIQLDVAGLSAFGKELQLVLQQQLDAIYEQAGIEFNVNSPKQLGEILFDRMGLPHRRKTKSGWSTDAETLESLRDHSPIIDNLLTYRTYQKLNSTYVEGLLKAVAPDGRIHSTFNQTETRTGRISSNEPNMQNIPVRTELGSRLRHFFVADEGMQFADADYSQIELRILAHISQDEAMQEAFLQGQDIHSATAAKVNGLPQEMVTPGMRSAAKAVNFGIVYGIGAFSLSKDIGVSVKEAEQFIKTYLDNFPGVRTYMEKTVDDGKQHGFVSTLYGRRRPLPELSSSNFNIRALGERMALNTPIQGTAADIIKLAMIRVFHRLRKEKLTARLLLQVHDELIVEAPQNEAGQVAAILQEEMQAAASLSVPMVADVHMGKTWLEAKG